MEFWKGRLIPTVTFLAFRFWMMPSDTGKCIVMHGVLYCNNDADIDDDDDDGWRSYFL